MTGFAVERAASVEVIAAWTVPRKNVTAAPSASAVWTSLGSYDLPRTTDAMLDVVGLVSHTDTTLEVRLWDEVTKAAINTLLSFTERVPTRKLGTILTLQGGRLYQVQARAITVFPSAWRFGAVLSATLTD